MILFHHLLKTDGKFLPFLIA